MALSLPVTFATMKVNWISKAANITANTIFAIVSCFMLVEFCYCWIEFLYHVVVFVYPAQDFNHILGGCSRADANHPAELCLELGCVTASVLSMFGMEDAVHKECMKLDGVDWLHFVWFWCATAGQWTNGYPQRADICRQKWNLYELVLLGGWTCPSFNPCLLTYRRMNLSTSYLVRLYPRSDSGVAHDLKLFAIVGGIKTASPHSCPQNANQLRHPLWECFNDIAGRIRLVGLVYQLGESDWHWIRSFAWITRNCIECAAVPVEC